MSGQFARSERSANNAFIVLLTAARPEDDYSPAYAGSFEAGIVDKSSPLVILPVCKISDL